MQSIEDAIKRLSGKSTDRTALYAAEQNTRTIDIDCRYRKALKLLSLGIHADGSPIRVGTTMMEAHIAATKFHYRTTPGLAYFLPPDEK
jgi:hypothetical protein